MFYNTKNPGCLNWKVMDVDAPSPFDRNKTAYCNNQHQRVDKTNNNGLDDLVFFLEKIYKTPNWPPVANAMPDGLSPYNSGKSRADLWQFAALVALENIIERSDFACRHDYWQRQQIPLLEGVNKGFTMSYGIWKCKFKLDNPLTTQFKTGRADCLPDHRGLPEDKQFPYATMKEENHKNPHGNAGPLLDDLRRDLGMSSRDVIALSSIHGMIAPFSQGSIGTKYAWIGSGPYLSNMYYKIIINRPTYLWEQVFAMSMGIGYADALGLVPFAVGDENGKPVASWGFRVSCSKCWNVK